ncbi:MAG: hypothetical protein H0V18_06285 [Pyrinomonadaceae bacterium]|nr:hypothetical protein [Pyrinomonadaceae bacterium]
MGDAIGQNAFGVKVRYSRTSVTSLLLAMPSDKAQAFQEGITFQTNKSKAAQIIGQASMAISGRLLYPFIAHQFDYKKPTIDSPSKIYYDNHYIIFRPEKVRIFRPATGEVFAFLELERKP